jgi:oxalate decarboxylase/phosphoglucose isomerase-like protein (cupin superfamily)
VHLPPGQPHCLENTGASTLRVLGVFHPGGSPAATQSRPAARTDEHRRAHRLSF